MMKAWISNNSKSCSFFATSKNLQLLRRHLVTAISLEGRRSVIELQGPDTGKLLQSISTQELSAARLSEMSSSGGGCAHTAFLTNKGRVLVGDAFVFVPPSTGIATLDESTYIDVAASELPALLRHLRMYKLRSKVKLRDASSDFEPWALFRDDPANSASPSVPSSLDEQPTAIREVQECSDDNSGGGGVDGGGGGAVERVLAALKAKALVGTAEHGETAKVEQSPSSSPSVAKQLVAMAARDPRVPTHLGWARALLPRHQEEAAEAAHKEQGEKAAASSAGARTLAALPDVTKVLSLHSGDVSTDVPTDVPTDEDGDAYYERRRLEQGLAEGAEWAGHVPLELNLELLNGVSFKKGCYLGQELTARTHFQGMVRKRTLPLLLTHPPSSVSDAATVCDNEGGEDNAGSVLPTWAELCERGILGPTSSAPSPLPPPTTVATILPGDNVVGALSGKVWGSVVSNSPSQVSQVVVAKLRLEVVGWKKGPGASDGEDKDARLRLLEPLVILRPGDKDDGEGSKRTVISGAAPFLPSWWLSSSHES